MNHSMIRPEDRLQLSSLVLTKAKELGADLVGIAGVDRLKDSPSHTLAPRVPPVEVGQGKGEEEPGVVHWPEDGKSVVVVAVSHPGDQPELDWWYGKRPPAGNKKLEEIISKLKNWLEERYSKLEARHLAYQVEKGGIYLKDAAVMAGLGCVGRNNLFISPAYGPRVRLRALMVNQELVSTGPVEFDPCSKCEKYCLKECPRGAFREVVYSQENTGQALLPAITGNYSREKCHRQMEEDIRNAEVTDVHDQVQSKGGQNILSLQNNKSHTHASHQSPERAQDHQGADGEAGTSKVKLVKYCRRCEYACILGQD